MNGTKTKNVNARMARDVAKYLLDRVDEDETRWYGDGGKDGQSFEEVLLARKATNALLGELNDWTAERQNGMDFLAENAMKAGREAGALDAWERVAGGKEPYDLYSVEAAQAMPSSEFIA